MFLISFCSCLCPIHWSQVLSQEWRCSWSSADRRCSNYIWVIDNFIVCWGVSCIRDFTVSQQRIRSWLDSQRWSDPMLTKISHTIGQYLVTSRINIGSGDGLLPDGTKALPEPMLANHHWNKMSPRLERIYRTISNIRHTKSPNLNVSRLVLELYLPKLLMPGIKSRMKM